jgi:hypothetical protein
MNFLPGWTDNPTRIVKLLVGIMLIGLAIVMLVVPEAGQVATTIGKVVPL